MSHERKRPIRQAIKGSARSSGTKSGPSRPAVVCPTENSAALGTCKRVADSQEASATTPAAQRPKFFNFDAQAVRVLGTEITPWFVAKDVCDALGIARTDSALRGLEDDEKGAHTVSTLGGPQELSTVNESGLYGLIFRSRKPQARLFRRWVTGQVLPSIRRTGHYATSNQSAKLPPNYDLTTRHLAQLASIVLSSANYAVVTVADLAPVAVKHELLFWVITDASSANQRVALAVTLKRILGWPLLLPSGGTASFEAIGKNRHRRYLILKDKEVHHA